MDSTANIERLRKEHNKRQRRKRRRRIAAAAMFVLAVGVCVYKAAPTLFDRDVIVRGTEHHEPTLMKNDPQRVVSYDEENWNLVLVNPWNSIPADWECTLTQLANGHAIDSRCYPDLQEMMDACRAEGLSPMICSSYRTREYQQKLFDEKTEEYIAAGYSRQEAEELTATSVAIPGTSEHQLGLALDIVGVDNQNLDSSQETSDVQRWLMENSWRYGFILRYPDGKTEITGIIYEPWHYRYVGREAAAEIFEQGVCLEEYLGVQ